MKFCLLPLTYFLFIMSGNALTEKELIDLGQNNLVTYKALWNKAGIEHGSPEQEWTYTVLKERLEMWEYYFLIAMMFEGVSSNGGWVHGMGCFFDPPPEDDMYVPAEDVIGAWMDIGDENTLRAINVGRSELKQLNQDKFNLLSYEDSKAIEAKMIEAYGEWSAVTDSRLYLYEYALKKGKVEQGAAANP